MSEFIEISIKDGESKPSVRRIKDPDNDPSTQRTQSPDEYHEWGSLYTSGEGSSILLSGKFGDFARHPDNPHLWLTMVDRWDNHQLEKAFGSIIENHQRQLRALFGAEPKRR